MEPYYLAIFTSKRSKDQEGYEEMDKETYRLVEIQPGYLGAENYSNQEGFHVAIIKFKTAEDIRRWKSHPRHQEAQAMGRHRWYEYYNVKVCKVEREYEFNKTD